MSFFLIPFPFDQALAELSLFAFVAAVRVKFSLRKMYEVLLAALTYLQLFYSVWQFVRVAKFFRIPSAFVYHSFLWMINKAGRPFAPLRFCQLTMDGAEFWRLPEQRFSPGEDEEVMKDFTLSRRQRSSKFLVNDDALQRLHYMDVDRPACYTSHYDLLLPNIAVVDVLDDDEGMERLIDKRYSFKVMECRCLLMSSREHFLNQNFMRLLSIVPLVMQAKGYNVESGVLSVLIILLDQLSYPANKLWHSFIKEGFVFIVRWCLQSIKTDSRRLYASVFMSTLTPRFGFCNEIHKNYYWVRRGERVAVYTNSCLKHMENVREAARPQASENVNSNIRVVDDELIAEWEPKRRGLRWNMSEFLVRGNPYLEHTVNGKKLHTFVRGLISTSTTTTTYLFRQQFMPGLLSALKYLEDGGQLPIIMNRDGNLHSIKVNTFLDSCCTGKWFCQGELLVSRWVADNKNVVGYYWSITNSSRSKPRSQIPFDSRILL